MAIGALGAFLGPASQPSAFNPVAGLSPTAGLGSPEAGLGGLESMAMTGVTIVGDLVGMLAGLMRNGGGGALGGGGGGLAGGLGSGGSVGGQSGGGGFGGAGGTGDVTMGSGTPNSGGAGAAQLAESMVGKAAGSLSFQNYTHAGGVTNDCADFVSGVIADTEGFHKTAGDAKATTLKSDLEAQGWVKVSKAQAQPGDVAIILGNGTEHTELCTKAGGQEFIGANGDATETVGRDNLNSASGVTYYHKPG